MFRRRRRSLAHLMFATLGRFVLAVLTAQLSIAATLIGWDAMVRRRRAKRESVRTTDPVELPVADSTTTTYTYGEDLYAAMLEAIAGAQKQILLESYIWKGDSYGERFRQALIDASNRGVEVFVIYDGFANLVVRRSFYDFPAPIHVMRYPAVRAGLIALNIRKSGRDHRKILVVDDHIGFVGGYNIGDVYATEWRDTHLRIVGPSAWELRNAFVDFWNTQRGTDHPALLDHGSDFWEPRIRAAVNAPAHMVFPIRGLYLAAIDRARHRIYITQGYFIPDREILEALLAAAGRGVDVRVLVPEVSNHVVADWLSRGLYTTLLRGGVTIWLYQGAMVHAKTATIDGAWTTIGTANIDRLSLTGNYEINVEIYDEGLAEEMERIFARDLANCRQLTLDEWKRRHVVARFSEAVLRPMRPLL